VRAPLSLPSDGRPLRFDPTRDWLAQLRIDELSLASLAAHVGELPIRGQLSAGLELSGSLADPRVDLRARVDELAAPSRSAVGQLLVRAGLEAGRVRL